MIERDEAARRLGEAARLLQGDYDPRQVARLLAPVNDWLYEQSRPPCTCGEGRGTACRELCRTAWSWYSVCLRHPNMSVGHVSTHPALERSYTYTTAAGERKGAE